MTAAVWFAPRQIDVGNAPAAVRRALATIASMMGGAGAHSISRAVGGMDWAGSMDAAKGGAKSSASKKNAAKQKAVAEKNAGEQASATAASAAQRESELDWTDIAGTLDGDGQAYARIVRRYQDQITAQMWRLSRQRNDCEQLVHEVFVEAYVSLRQYKGRAPFLHWLRKIATRVGYRYWKQQARARRQASVPLQDWHRSVPAADIGVAEEAAALVHGLLDKLPPRDRLVLTLIYLEECSVAEAAELSGWSQTMVKVQAHRARKKLKKLLDEANVS